MKANIPYIWAFLLFLILINCSYYPTIDRIGGDITGFREPYGTIRFYSNSNDYHIIEILNDTNIDNINYRIISFDYNRKYITYNDEWIMERILFNDRIVNIPFMNRILLEYNRFEKEEEALYYNYTFYMFIDSIVSVKRDTLEYNNVYAIHTQLNLNIEDRDTIIENRFLLSNKYGIIGIYDSNDVFVLDSIIK